MKKYEVTINGHEFPVPRVWNALGHRYQSCVQKEPRNEDDCRVFAMVDVNNNVLYMQRDWPDVYTFWTYVIHEGIEIANEKLELNLPHSTICAIAEALGPLFPQFVEAQ